MIVLLIIVIFVCIVAVKYLPLGYINYKNSKMQSTLTVPSLSIFDKECCMTSTMFKSIRSVYSLENELEKIMKTKEKISCNSKTYYYDKENDLTIIDYGVEPGFVLNSFFITYAKEYYCN